jgi:hypothetical protein
VGEGVGGSKMLAKTVAGADEGKQTVASRDRGLRILPGVEVELMTSNDKGWGFRGR